MTVSLEAYGLLVSALGQLIILLFPMFRWSTNGTIEAWFEDSSKRYRAYANQIGIFLTFLGFILQFYALISNR